MIIKKCDDCKNNLVYEKVNDIFLSCNMLEMQELSLNELG